MIAGELLRILHDEITRTLDRRRRFLLQGHKACLEEVVAKRKRAERLQQKIEASCIRALKMRELRFASAEDEAALERAIEAEGDQMTEH
jgi:hypothetical protein